MTTIPDRWLIGLNNTTIAGYKLISNLLDVEGLFTRPKKILIKNNGMF